MRDTLVYVWGYGTPDLPLFRAGNATEAAQKIAARRGWNAARKGAWAREITVPRRPESVPLLVEAEARRDPAVEGWLIIDGVSTRT